jgi:hypothetical protein
MTDMKPNVQTEAARTGPVVPDDGRQAARALMVSTLFLFTFIFVLQALAP